MGEARTPKEEKPRRWYELHFRTVVALTLAATVLIWANVLPGGGCDSCIGTSFYIYRGWPVEAVCLQWWPVSCRSGPAPGWEAFHRGGPDWLTIDEEGKISEEEYERGYDSFTSGAALANLLFALFILAAVALLCELGIRVGKRVRAGPTPGEGKVGA